jgi:hypothetical protein
MKRGTTIFSVIFIIGILSIGFVSAGLIGWIKNIFEKGDNRFTGKLILEGEGYCGDKICYGNHGENFLNCPVDCIVSTPPDCGDKTCAHETRYINLIAPNSNIIFFINGNKFKISFEGFIGENSYANLRVDNFNRKSYTYEYNAIRALKGEIARIGGLPMKFEGLNGSGISLLVGEDETICPVDCSENIPTCIDSDNGINYDIIGKTSNFSNGYIDYCDSNNLIEYSCNLGGSSINVQSYACPYGCFNRTCITPTECMDSDGGLNYGVLGTASGDWYGPYNNKYDFVGKITDVCDTNPGASNYIWEYYCNGSDSLQTVHYFCLNGCYNGACINYIPINQTNLSSNQTNVFNQTILNQTTSFPNQSIEESYSNNSLTPNININDASNVVPEIPVLDENIIEETEEAGRTIEANITESKIYGEGIDAVSEATLSESEGKIYASNSKGGTSEIKISPDEALEKISKEIKPREIKGIKLKEYKRIIIYEIDSRKTVKILALISADMKIVTKINVENGDIIDVNKPWWSLFAKEE